MSLEIIKVTIQQYNNDVFYYKKIEVIKKSLYNNTITTCFTIKKSSESISYLIIDILETREKAEQRVSISQNNVCCPPIGKYNSSRLGLKLNRSQLALLRSHLFFFHAVCSNLKSWIFCDL